MCFTAHLAAVRHSAPLTHPLICDLLVIAPDAVQVRMALKGWLHVMDAEN